MKHMAAQQQNLEPFREIASLESSTEPLAIPEFLSSASQSDVTDSSHSQTWSALDTPMHSAATWSTGNTAASPASSSHDFFFDSPFSRRGLGSNGVTMIGKSAWGPTDWLSANPRLDQSTANSSSPSYFGGMSPSPNSPFAFTHLSHGVLDRYDLFPPSLAHDFASEAGPEHDGLSTFSDPEMMPSSAFHGVTHHSNYAGDLIFGTRSHQPPVSVDYGPGFGFGAAGAAAGLGLALHPLQMHTPALPGIDEIELAAINLNDGEPESVDVDAPMDVVERKPQPQSHPHRISNCHNHTRALASCQRTFSTSTYNSLHQAHPFAPHARSHTRRNIIITIITTTITSSRADHFRSHPPSTASFQLHPHLLSPLHARFPLTLPLLAPVVPAQSLHS
jgi:hypothetical protein